MSIVVSATLRSGKRCSLDDVACGDARVVMGQGFDRRHRGSWSIMSLTGGR